MMRHKGPGSRAAGVAMAFKLIESAQARWRTVNAPHLVALVRALALVVTGSMLSILPLVVVAALLAG
jgi:hypothetical protein